MASLLGSAHSVQLEESLRGITHDLEATKHEAAANARVRQQLETQLDESQKKCSTAIVSKMSLENAKLDLEFQVSGVCVCVVCDMCIMCRSVSSSTKWISLKRAYNPTRTQPLS